MNPKIGIGMTLYNNEKYLREAIESLLSQSYRDFILVLLDDCSTDNTEKIARDYTQRDKRLHYYRNDSRQGLIKTWRKVFDLCQQPGDVDYFAWASDHDIWKPEWLTTLVTELTTHKDVVLVYPLTQRIDERGNSYPVAPEKFETFAVSDPRQRLISVCSMRGHAGNMIYGLFRAKALAQAGVFSSVLYPDRALLIKLSLYGQFRQVPEVLWLRRFRKEVSLQGQRRSLYGGRTPLYTYLPWSFTHAGILGWHLFENKKLVFAWWRSINMVATCLWVGAKKQLNKERKRNRSKRKR